jgi:hypothetical protein
LFLNKNLTINVPSMIPPVVLNALITSGNKINFIDDTEWIGGSYTLHKFEDYKIINYQNTILYCQNTISLVTLQI